MTAACAASTAAFVASPTISPSPISLIAGYGFLESIHDPALGSAVQRGIGGAPKQDEDPILALTQDSLSAKTDCDSAFQVLELSESGHPVLGRTRLLRRRDPMQALVQDRVGQRFGVVDRHEVVGLLARFERLLSRLFLQNEAFLQQKLGQHGPAEGERVLCAMRRALLVLQSQEQDFLMQPELGPVVHRSSV